MNFSSQRGMGIRIDHIRSGSTSVVHIAGRLCGIAAAELKNTCDPIEGPLVLDLSSLLFADERGIRIIRAIVEKGAHVRGASPFIELLLENAQNEIQAVRRQSKFVWS